MQENTEKAVQHIMDAAEEALGYYFSLFEEEKDSPPAAIAELREALDAYPLAELQDAAEAEEYYPGRFCMMIGGHHQGENLEDGRRRLLPQATRVQSGPGGLRSTRPRPA